MRHKKANKRLGRPTGHRLLMLRNIASDFFVHGRIQTTQAKAKEAQMMIEKMITLARRDDLHAKRQVMATLNKEATKALYAKIPDFGDRTSGHTRIVKLYNRRGDDAPMVMLAFVD